MAFNICAEERMCASEPLYVCVCVSVNMCPVVSFLNRKRYDTGRQGMMSGLCVCVCVSACVCDCVLCIHKPSCSFTLYFVCVCGKTGKKDRPTFTFIIVSVFH